MSYLEITLFVLTAVLPFFISRKNGAFRIKHLYILPIAIFILHGIIDGFRWQMIPIYIINFVLIICLFKNWRFFKGNWFRKIMSTVFLFLFIGLGFLFSTTLPVFDLPQPTGEYKVGADYFHLKSNIDEPLTEQLGDKRELMIKVWYPANINQEEKEHFLDKGNRVGFSIKYGLPENTFSYLDKVETNTYQKPAIADGQFPILIFSHGQYSMANGYYALLEEIVSQGYIVLNINHTYESVGTLFPDGEVRLYANEYDRKHNNEDMAKLIWETMEAFNKANTKNEKSKILNSPLKEYYAAEVTQRWSNDIRLVLNHIPQWEKSTFLSNHIDTSKIGVFGHSQGGAAAGQALLDEPKISAGINVDGVQWGNMVDTFLAKPFLLLSSEWPAEHPNFNEIAYQNGSRADFYAAKIKNTGHSNFMDIPFMVNLSQINEAGDIEPEKAIKISANIIVDFFNKYLKSKDNDLMELGEQIPELEIEKLE